MELNTETLILAALVGAAAGWLGHRVASAPRWGQQGAIAAGVVGAVLAVLAVPKLGLDLGGSDSGVLLIALVGAVVVLVGATFVGDTVAREHHAHAERSEATTSHTEPTERRRQGETASPTRRNATDPTAGQVPLVPESGTGGWTTRQAPTSRQEREPVGREVPEPRPWFRRS
jgi:uncharacterized membrane protein YeaQ/YmgE (transglycosylase-associated protein family)